MDEIQRVEKELKIKMSLICQAANIRLDEWELNAQLYEALLKSPNNEVLEELCSEYDALIMYLQMLGHTPSRNFYWFHELTKAKKTINSDE